MKKYIEEEIEALSFNLDVILEKLKSGELSTSGAIIAEEIAGLLIKLKDILCDETTREEDVSKIVLKLPLLYFQIPKLN